MIVWVLREPTEWDHGVIEGDKDLAKNDDRVGEKENMAIGMSIVPAKVDTNFGRADVFNVGVIHGCPTKHGQWVGFDTADCSKG